MDLLPLFVYLLVYNGKGEITLNEIQAYQYMFTSYPDVVTVKQLAEMLGICTKKAYQLISDREIKVLPCSYTYKIPKLYVIEYILNKAA